MYKYPINVYHKITDDQPNQQALQAHEVSLMHCNILSRSVTLHLNRILGNICVL